jgi:uncharacterized membrane protein
MIIKTHPFELDRKQYFRLNIRQYIFKRKKLYILILIALSIAGFLGYITDLFKDPFFLSLFGVALGLLALLIIIVPLNFYYYAKTPKNNLFFTKRTMEWNNERMKVVLEDGSLSELKLNTILEIQQFPDYYLIYISKHQFYYLPFNAFKSNDDHQAFQELMQSIGKLNK